MATFLKTAVNIAVLLFYLFVTILLLIEALYHKSLKAHIKLRFLHKISLSFPSPRLDLTRHQGWGLIPHILVIFSWGKYLKIELKMTSFSRKVILDQPCNASLCVALKGVNDQDDLCGLLPSLNTTSQKCTC